MACVKIVARCTFDDILVGYICINKEQHTAWFTDIDFDEVLYKCKDIGYIVKTCESLGVTVTPTMRK